MNLASMISVAPQTSPFPRAGGGPSILAVFLPQNWAPACAGEGLSLVDALLTAHK